MNVPFLDLQRLHASIRPALDDAYGRVLAASSFVGGEEVSALEAEMAGGFGRRGAAACASGTDALSLALRSFSIGSGDEVIVPSMTFIATAEAVVHVGATPVIADVDPVSLLLDPTSVDAVRTPQTRAVIPVDLYGHVTPRDDLRAWRDQGLVVIEDAAQAHLASWNGELIGADADAVCFSFYPGKNLGALGDAGMVMSDGDEVITAVRSLRDHGRSTKYVHDQIGYSSRLDGLQAAFLRAKLTHLPAWTAARRRLADRYRQRLEELCVPWTDGAVHHLLVVRVDGRDEVQKELSERGVATGVHYPVPLSLQPALAPWARTTPDAERAAGEILSLPMDPLMTEEDVDYVCETLLAVLSR